MDIVGPFPPSRKQNKWWLTLLDAYSKDVELCPTREADAVHIAKAIMLHWVCRRGCPRILVSDNAKAFIGQVAQQLCSMMQVKHELITPYHHKGTALVERIHSYAESILRVVTEQKYSLWDEKLPFIQFAIMTHAIDNTEITPFQIKDGVPATLPGDLLVDSFTLPKDLRQYYERAQQTIQATRKYFRVQRRKRRIQTRLATDRLQRRYRTNFKAGEPVFVSKPSFTRVDGIKGLKKLEGQHRGPYEVISTDSHNNVLVNIDGTEEKFSVETCDQAHTMNPKNRLPPQYKQGLKYDPPQQTNDEDQPHNLDDNGEAEKKYALRSNKRKRYSEEKEEKPPKKKTKQSESKKQQPAMTRGRDRLLIQDDGIQKAHLYKRAKRGKYHPVWFDPKDISDPPKSKAQPSKPQGWEPWTVIPEHDDTWEIIKPIANNLKALDHKLIK
jgi:hypothetical protein